MRISLGAVLVAVMVGGCAGSVWIPGTRDRPYVVYGTNTDAARRQILAVGPSVRGQPKAAATTYRFQPDVRVISVYTEDDDGSGSCTCKQRVRGARVRLSLLETFPDWANYGQAAPLCQRVWDQYMRELKAHELEHVTVAHKMRTEWEQELVGLSTTARGDGCLRACADARAALADVIAVTNEANHDGHAALQDSLDESHHIPLASCRIKAGGPRKNMR
jgi:predicted secreted Zn-dependent protease